MDERRGSKRTSVKLGEKIRVVGLNRFMDHYGWRVESGQEPRVCGDQTFVWVKWECTGEFAEVDASLIESIDESRQKRRRMSPFQGRVVRERRVWADMNSKRDSSAEEEVDFRDKDLARRQKRTRTCGDCEASSGLNEEEEEFEGEEEVGEQEVNEELQTDEASELESQNESQSEYEPEDEPDDDVLDIDLGTTATSSSEQGFDDTSWEHRTREQRLKPQIQYNEDTEGNEDTVVEHLEKEKQRAVSEVMEQREQNSKMQHTEDSAIDLSVPASVIVQDYERSMTKQKKPKKLASKPGVVDQQKKYDEPRTPPRCKRIASKSVLHNTPHDAHVEDNNAVNQKERVDNMLESEAHENESKSEDEPEDDLLDEFPNIDWDTSSPLEQDFEDTICADVDRVGSPSDCQEVPYPKPSTAGAGVTPHPKMVTPHRNMEDCAASSNKRVSDGENCEIVSTASSPRPQREWRCRQDVWVRTGRLGKRIVTVFNAHPSFIINNVRHVRVRWESSKQFEDIPEHDIVGPVELMHRTRRTKRRIRYDEDNEDNEGHEDAAVKHIVQKKGKRTVSEVSERGGQDSSLLQVEDSAIDLSVPTSVIVQNHEQSMEEQKKQEDLETRPGVVDQKKKCYKTSTPLRRKRIARKTVLNETPDAPIPTSVVTAHVDDSDVCSRMTDYSALDAEISQVIKRFPSTADKETVSKTITTDREATRQSSGAHSSKISLESMAGNSKAAIQPTSHSVSAQPNALFENDMTQEPEASSKPYLHHESEHPNELFQSNNKSNAAKGRETSSKPCSHSGRKGCLKHSSNTRKSEPVKKSAKPKRVIIIDLCDEDD